MNLATIIAVIALALVVFLAIRYIYKEKKKGSKCIGCPFAEGCRKYHCDGNRAAASCDRNHSGSGGCCR